jgi:preprotein translocase SecE subunit
MAVAVKSPPEKTSSVLDRMAVVSLLGTVYVLGVIGIVFFLLPSLWWATFPATWGSGLGLAGLMILAGFGLAVLGNRMLGERALPGTRAGIFMGLVFALIVLLLTRWVSMALEYYTYDRAMMSPTVGAVVTGVVGLIFLLLMVRIFLRPGFERFLVGLESQGWFTARAYKPQQGLKVRRGTIFGLLVIAGAGIYTLVNRGSLERGAVNWQIDVPFTSRVEITKEGDAADILSTLRPGHAPASDKAPVYVDRDEHKGIAAAVNPETHRKISYRRPINDEKLDKIVPRPPVTGKVLANLVSEVMRAWSAGALPQSAVASELFAIKTLDFDLQVTDQLVTNDELRNLKDSNLVVGLIREKDVVAPQWGYSYAALPLLPSVALTVPLLLILVSLWLAWRIVNVPVFADFLIATEAELNKVSWTTQRRLVQDTIVVLVTVFLMAIFLFTMDQVWRIVLSWEPIGVLKVQHQDNAEQPVEKRPW